MDTHWPSGPNALAGLGREERGGGVCGLGEGGKVPGKQRLRARRTEVEKDNRDFGRKGIQSAKEKQTGERRKEM